jgi:hypothetical protein
MEVRNKKKLELIDDASHELKCVFYISIRILKLKKGTKELNNLAHLKTKILNIKNRSKNPVVCGTNCTPFFKRFIRYVSTSTERSRCWCGLHVEVYHVKRNKVRS